MGLRDSRLNDRNFLRFSTFLFTEYLNFVPILRGMDIGSGRERNSATRPTPILSGRHRDTSNDPKLLTDENQDVTFTVTESIKLHDIFCKYHLEIENEELWKS